MNIVGFNALFIETKWEILQVSREGEKFLVDMKVYL